MRADKQNTTDLILKVTYRTPGLTAWQIAGRTGVRCATVSSLLVKLVRRGVLRRQQGDGLPNKGWQYYHAA